MEVGTIQKVCVGFEWQHLMTRYEFERSVFKGRLGHIYVEGIDVQGHIAEIFTYFFSWQNSQLGQQDLLQDYQIIASNTNAFYMVIIFELLQV